MNVKQKNMIKDDAYTRTCVDSSNISHVQTRAHNSLFYCKQVKKKYEIEIRAKIARNLLKM